MVDWNLIRTDYITQGLSYRDLAKKYPVSAVSIGKHGKKEGWVELRKQNDWQLQEKMLDVIQKDRVKRAHRIQCVADKLLGKVEQSLETEEGISSGDLKNLAGILKSVKEIQMIRSPLDEQEQRAKISALEKQAEKESGGEGISVELEGLTQDWAR